MAADRQSFAQSVEIRPLAEADSVAELTSLLHRAYKRLLDMGRSTSRIKAVEWTEATQPNYRSVIMSKRLRGVTAAIGGAAHSEVKPT